MSTISAAAFWAFLLIYGITMYLVSPRSRGARAFFRGADSHGRPVGGGTLAASIFISWIFAKSVTNAANLGAEYGLVGGLAYATYWLSIPFAGVVIYRIRTTTGARSLAGFLASRYGRTASLGFFVAILIRLYNEVWSNSAVVGSYFGAPGEFAYYAAALLFTVFTLAYSLKGGLRGSIVTDLIQAVVFVTFITAVLLLFLPRDGADSLVASGKYSLRGGMDLLLVAGLQIFSYPFHDPVLTDRGFVNDEKRMRLAFTVAGLVGFLAILAFSLVGVHARLNAIAIADNAPAAVGRAVGVGAYFLMSIVMITSAGSTLDSTFTSLSKALAVDLPSLARRKPASRPKPRTGAWAMIVFAVLGSLPLFTGAAILKATTVSGTMVMGLAPVFLLSGFTRHSPWSFHLSFWPGVVLGVLMALDALPRALAIGNGDYAMLLGVNAWGLCLCTAGFLLPLAGGALSAWRARVEQAA